MDVNRKQCVYELDDAETLQRALVRMDLLGEHGALPACKWKRSGAAGKSRVYFLTLVRGSAEVKLVAKFDEPDRAAAEWRAIQELRKLNLPTSVLLPLADNQPSDGVILYHDTSALALAADNCELRQWTARWLCSATGTFPVALDWLLGQLRVIHSREPGQSRSQVDGETLRWRHFFDDDARKLQAIREQAQKTWELDWDSPTFDLPVMVPGANAGRTVPNPLHHLEAMLDNPTNDLRLSRIHGDLNFGNVLLHLDGHGAVMGGMIIDPAKSRAKAPTVLDLARLEIEFWHEPFATVRPDQSVWSEHDKLKTMLSVRDGLDGRLPVLVNAVQPLGRRTFDFLASLRRQASDLLNPGVENYMLADYFRTLSLSHLYALAWETVNESVLKRRLAILGAALSLQVLRDLENRSYAPPAGNLASPVRICKERDEAMRKQNENGGGGESGSKPRAGVINVFAKKLGPDWRALANELGIDRSEQERMHGEDRGHEGREIWHWVMRRGTGEQTATQIAKLADACRAIGRPELAELIEDAPFN